jgi:transposase-like protein
MKREKTRKLWALAFIAFLFGSTATHGQFASLNRLYRMIGQRSQARIFTGRLADIEELRILTRLAPDLEAPAPSGEGLARFFFQFDRQVVRRHGHRQRIYATSHLDREFHSLAPALLQIDSIDATLVGMAERGQAMNEDQANLFRRVVQRHALRGVRRHLRPEQHSTPGYEFLNEASPPLALYQELRRRNAQDPETLDLLAQAILEQRGFGPTRVPRFAPENLARLLTETSLPYERLLGDYEGTTLRVRDSVNGSVVVRFSNAADRSLAILILREDSIRVRLFFRELGLHLNENEARAWTRAFFEASINESFLHEVVNPTILRNRIREMTRQDPSPGRWGGPAEISYSTPGSTSFQIAPTDRTIRVVRRVVDHFMGWRN